MEGQEKKARPFMSLKLKWAFGTAIGSLIISLIVIITIFSAFTNDLLSQERSSLSHSLNTITEQLGVTSGNQKLTTATINKTLAKRALAQQNQLSSSFITRFK